MFVSAGGDGGIERIASIQILLLSEGWKRIGLIFFHRMRGCVLICHSSSPYVQVQRYISCPLVNSSQSNSLNRKET